MSELPSSYVGIGVEDVFRSEAQASLFEDTASFVATETIGLIADHDSLYSFLDKKIERAGFNRQIFNVGSAMTYEMLPNQVKTVPLSDMDMQRTQLALAKSIMKREGNVIDVNLGWLTEELGKDSPEYITWMREFVQTVGEENSPSFAFGCLLTILPFYLREKEAQNVNH